MNTTSTKTCSLADLNDGDLFVYDNRLFRWEKPNRYGVQLDMFGSIIHGNGTVTALCSFANGTERDPSTVVVVPVFPHRD